jgi:hypothetical protein
MTTALTPRLPAALTALLDRQLDAIADRHQLTLSPRHRLLQQQFLGSVLEELGCLPEETRDADETATLLSYTATAGLAWLKLMGEARLTEYERDRVRDTATRLREAAAHLDALTQDPTHPEQE